MSDAWPRRRGARTSAATLAAFVALFVAARMLFVGVPNVTPAYFVVLVAGLAFGPWIGAATGFVGMVLTNLLLTGPHPVLLVNSSAMALLGLFAGFLGWAVDPLAIRVPLWAKVAALALLGVVFTALFSVAADLADWLFMVKLMPEATDPVTQERIALVLVLRGLAFNVPSMVVNAVLFASATLPVLRAIREAGLAPQPSARSSSTPR